MNETRIKELAYLINEETGFKLTDKEAWARAKYVLIKQQFYNGKRCPCCGYIGNTHD